jgi:formate dehydrogenase gamma subunit
VWFTPQAVAQSNKPQLPKQDEVCLACHGQPGFKSGTGKNVFVDSAKHAASIHGALSCQDCHAAITGYPHAAKIPGVECTRCHATQANDVSQGVHGLLRSQSCQSCHGDPHEVRPAVRVAPAKCAECHAQEMKDLQESVHGRAAEAGDPFAPTCASCHGPAHKIVATSDPSSMVARKNLANTCAACHANKDFLARHNLFLAHPVEQYKQSVHARAVAAGKEAATCASCHGSHAIFSPRDSRSKINHWNIAATCGQCHAGIAQTYLSSVHGQAMQAGVRDAPVCTDCHGEHLILAPTQPESPVSAALVSSMTCGRCHGDKQLIQRYNLPADRVPSYADSFHGLAMREGSQTVANCASCHGVHDIYPSSDPRSTVNPANLAATCGKCHPGAGTRFAIGPVHVRITTGAAEPVVKWIRELYLVLIPIVLGFMVLHNALDFFAKLRRRRRLLAGPPQIVRMDLAFRIFHWVVMVSFPTLVLTGFALRYPDQWWARPLMLLESHIAFRGVLHRTAGVLLIVAMAYHLVRLILSPRDRNFFRHMLVRTADARDLLEAIGYNLGLAKEPPRFGRFNYAEKLEYWAFVWGTAVMSITGLLLWFNSFTLRHFPKWALDAATAVHFYEALLAAFSILLWHFYMVIFDPDVYPTDLAWLTGKVPAKHYAESRPEYVREELERGVKDLHEAGKTKREKAAGEANQNSPANGDGRLTELRKDVLKQP